MTYSLKLDIDGWELALLLEAVARASRTCFAMRGEGAYGKDVFDLQVALAELLPLGGEEMTTAKLNLSPGAIDQLRAVLKAQKTRTQGDDDDAAEAYARLLEYVDGYLEAVEDVRRGNSR